ncbi:MAG: PIG-L deacetylase family protein [Acidimicrobiia bacterium]
MTADTIAPTPQRVLAVCAHPDDESFGLGAIISTLIDQGASVDLVCLTQGEASTLGAPTLVLAEARRCELAAAANELGVTTVHQFDHPDGHLSTVDLAVLTAAIQPLANDIDLLLVFDEGGITGQPDHVQATAAAMAVADALDLPVLAWTLDAHVANALNTEFDARFVGQTDSQIHIRLPVDRRRQRAAMRCHDSQLTGNPVPERRIALTGDTEPLRFLRRTRPPTHDTKDPIR